MLFIYCEMKNMSEPSVSVLILQLFVKRNKTFGL